MESSCDKSSDIQILRELEQIIFHIKEENIEYSVHKTINFFNALLFIIIKFYCKALNLSTCCLVEIKVA